MADLRVALVGTPDAANFGDVLFPVIAAHELRARLGEIELVAYGYRNVSASDWPYAVRSLGALAGEIADYDLLLVGGGHLIRDDAVIADGYAPSDQRVHRPLGLWLVPTLLAHAAGVPVAWNAVGVSESLGQWLAPLIRVAVGGAAYVAVRDENSAKSLAGLVPDAEIHVVPDTAFGAPAVVDEEARRAALELLAAARIGDRGYVVVQATSGLSAVRAPIEEVLRAARERDLAVLEVPIGPILGDVAGAFEIPGQVATLAQWPPPTVLAALLSGAEAIIHQSLHAGVVGFAAGVPCLRRPMPAGGKHDQLGGLPDVHLLGQNGATSALGHRRPDARGDAIRRTIRGALHAHWDTVAALVAGRESGRRGELLEFVAGLPALLERSSARVAELERLHAMAAEYKAAYHAFAYRTEELSDQLAASRHAEAELEYLRHRDQTLQRVLDGGWWRLRSRLLPLLRLAGRAG